MKSQVMEKIVVGIPCQQIVCRVESRLKMGYLQESPTCATPNKDSLCKQLKSRSPIVEALKRKLSLGARVLQFGSTKRVFKKVFGCREGEKIGKMFRCCLSTTAGPIQGMLFLSNENLSFCSNRLIKIPSASVQGEVVRIRYKVTIPLQRITTINERENDEKPLEKYIQVVTSDNFDFWFMRFFNHHKTYKHLYTTILNDSSCSKEHHLRLN
uniref:GRAM domain-containing protein n=1 Tax=Kalanchoe fedtschenkoi TaxID=63787 RepID=A0A7N0UG27_KALFE